MQIEPFKLERYFDEYEFKVRCHLSPSDCESLWLAELLALADAESLRRKALSATQPPDGRGQHPIDVKMLLQKRQDRQGRFTIPLITLHPPGGVAGDPWIALFKAPVMRKLVPGDRLSRLDEACQFQHQVNRIALDEACRG